jgi:broad specificity phosphatase PhoE
MTVTEIYWVRHAPVTHLKGRIYGRTDVDCDTGDDVLFNATAAELPHDAVWVTSSLRRTHQTAEALIRGGVPGGAFHSDPDLDEQSMGDWQGHTWDEVDEKFNRTAHRFWIAPATIAPPGGESFADLVKRTGDAMQRVVETHRGRKVIAVAHGGTIRAALSIALDIDPEAALAFQVENVSVTRMDHIDDTRDGGAWRIPFVNRMFRPRSAGQDF